MPVAKLLLGVRADKGATITVKVDKKPDSMPVLQVHSEGQPVTGKEGADQAWIVELGAGDHVLLLAVHEGERFEGQVRFVIDREVTTFLVGNSPEDIYGGTTPIGVAENPKDPWPPPAPNRAYAAEEVPWLAATLWRLSQGLDPTRSYQP